jgi:hypothetical protein
MEEFDKKVASTVCAFFPTCAYSSPDNLNTKLQVWNQALDWDKFVEKPGPPSHKLPFAF